MKATTTSGIEAANFWLALASEGAGCSPADLDAWADALSRGSDEIAAQAALLEKMPAASGITARAGEMIQRDLDALQKSSQAWQARNGRYTKSLTEANTRIEAEMESIVPGTDGARERLAALRRELEAVKAQKW